MKRDCLILTIGLSVCLCGCAGDDGTIGGSGFIETDEVVVSAEASGRVLTMGFREGQLVTIGDTLAVIDPSRMELELATARAGKKVALAKLRTARLHQTQAARTEVFAKAELDRVRQLLESGTATEKQFDALEYEHLQAQIAVRAAHSNVLTLEAEAERITAEIARLERQLADCYPVAPLTGTVTEEYVEVGELVNPGKAIAKISRLDTVWVKAFLPAGDFANVKLGDRATVDTESGGRTFEGEVIQTADQAEFTPKNVQTEPSRSDLVYAVKVQVPNIDSSLKVGMPVYVTLGKQ
jgi:HlyD family secretion protein